MVKALIRRMDADPKKDRGQLVSINDRDVPTWQRQTVWNDQEMGLLACSILKNYPIGTLILWKKSDGVRVPIDGRQRLTAIYRFFTGDVALPELPSVPEKWRGCKYTLKEGDDERGFKELSLEEKEIFDDYQIHAVEYEGIDENIAMEIFVMLQGGKSLTKTEVRAALGGQLCDFVTDLTAGPLINPGDDEEEEREEAPAPSKHPFFNALTPNLANRRKSHRNVADILLHEHLNPGQDKHWTSLETMYREKAHSLTTLQKSTFRTSLARFQRDTTTKIKRKKVLIPQVRSAFLILTIYRAWNALTDSYDMPKGFAFAKSIAAFETERAERADEIPWVNFTAALSNAGYAQNRIDERHDILMSYLLQKNPAATLKARDAVRTFSLAQKIAIWERAKHRCEWIDERKSRCKEVFENPRKADADHVVMWKENGPTSVENGRLLCQKHNRGRKT